MDKTIRFGVVGLGLMGREFAAALARWCCLLEFPVRAELVAACAAGDKSLEWARRNFPGLRQATTDYRQLLANPEVDAVYCAIPHHLHGSVYADAIRAGKHLLGEKPFGMDRAAFDLIAAAAREHPEVVARCSSEFPFFPGPQRIMRHLRETNFGTILEVECGLLHSSDLDPDKPANWKRRVETNGGYGCMGDLGMHVWHLPLRAGWRPANVRAILSNPFPRRPDGAGGTVECATWANATLLCEVRSAGGPFPLTAKMQRLAPGQTNTWYIAIHGTRFSARFSTAAPRTLETLRYEKGRPQEWRREALGCASVYKTVTGGIFEFGFSDAILQMSAAFCDEISRGGRAGAPFGCATLEEAGHTHAVFTAALQSHRARRVVEVQGAHDA